MNKRYTGTGTSRQQTSDMADFAHWSDSIVWSLEILTYERAPKLQELQYTVMVHASVSDPEISSSFRQVKMARKQGKK
jgi:hypothetical protein